MGKIEEWLTKDYSEYTVFKDIYQCIEYAETKNYLTQVITNYNYYTKLYN